MCEYCDNDGEWEYNVAYHEGYDDGFENGSYEGYNLGVEDERKRVLDIIDKLQRYGPLDLGRLLDKVGPV